MGPHMIKLYQSQRSSKAPTYLAKLLPSLLPDMRAPRGDAPLIGDPPTLVFSAGGRRSCAAPAVTPWVLSLWD